MARRIYERYTRKANRCTIIKRLVRVVLLSGDLFEGSSLKNRLCNGKGLKTRYLSFVFQDTGTLFAFRARRYIEEENSCIQQVDIDLEYRGNDVFLKYTSF